MEFFRKRGHAIIPSAPLVPQNDPSVLFNTAGMQPLVPYLLGEPHPAGKRLADAQKCVRTQDIDEVGDNTHDTFFEMLGNWSLGDYFKEDAIKWSFEFLTSKEEGLGLDPKRLYVTVFGGNTDAPKDIEAFAIWKQFMPEHRIYFMTADAKGKEPNWWAAGDNGPCGPDTEMFYDVTERGLGDMTKDEYMAADDRQEVVEIWNDVFMEYLKKDGKIVGKLPAQNVDTGAGLERLTMVMQKKDNIFETDLFAPLMKAIEDSREKREERREKDEERAMRIVADHIRTSVFMIADGVTPSNTDQGYILRRLIRRAVRYADKLGLEGFGPLVDAVIVKYGDVYPNVREGEKRIKEEILKEEDKFRNTLGMAITALKKFFNRAFGGIDPEHLPEGMQIKGNILRIDGRELFNFYQSYGLPIEIAQEIMQGWGLEFDEHTLKEAQDAMKKHQDLSRAGAAQKFAGGLADHSEVTVRLHTAHHLLLRALQIVLGPDVHQRGSNITAERLRIDFSAPAKMTDEQKKEVERIVNEKIAEALPVIRTEMTYAEAEKLGAEHEFGAKYPERVSVYSVGPKDATLADPKFAERYSVEFCGGPHVKNTNELGKFRILKEEAVSAGVRRIKATLEY